MVSDNSSKQPLPSYLPPRDRRRGKRYLTLKNFAIAILFSAVAFTALSIRSEMRRTKPGEFGELSRVHDRDPIRTVPLKVPVVTEAPVPEKPNVDPMTLDQANRTQFLEGGEEGSQLATATTTPQTFTIDSQYSSRSHSRVRITGGQNGIWIERKPQ